MGFLKELKSWIGLEDDSTSANVSESSPLFVYIKLPCNLQPIERGEKFEDPIQEALEKEKLGTVTGGGSQLADPDDEGRPTIEFCGIDVDLYSVEKGLDLLRRELIRLQAPQGTMLLYELDGHEYEEPIYRATV